MNLRSAQIVQVLRVVTVEGEGNAESLVREVVTYLDLDGSVLWTMDPAPPGTVLPGGVTA